MVRSVPVVKICETCGKEYETYFTRSAYCSEECRKIGYRIKRRGKKKKKATTAVNESINEIAKKTVHYGLYVAEEYLAQKERERVKQKSVETQEAVMDEVRL